jgi:hypothetical protein
MKKYTLEGGRVREREKHQKKSKALNEDLLN